VSWRVVYPYEGARSERVSDKGDVATAPILVREPPWSTAQNCGLDFVGRTLPGETDSQTEGQRTRSYCASTLEFKDGEEMIPTKVLYNPRKRRGKIISIDALRGETAKSKSPKKERNNRK